MCDWLADRACRLGRANGYWLVVCDAYNVQLSPTFLKEVRLALSLRKSFFGTELTSAP